jgi:superfamily II DNA or RNA helicase
MRSAISRGISNKLYLCQREAIQMIERYLSSKTTDLAALVQMPMGTGKTGVMALACTQFKTFNRVLVLAPAEYLTRQIELAIRTKFWDDAKISNPQPPTVGRFTPSSFTEKTLETRVLVSTIQSLQMMYSNGASDKFQILKESVDLVLFDEGHREPSLTWAKAIRALGKPVILFTATPYRNDDRKFNVSEEFIYRFRFESAMQQNIIRDVSIESYPANTGANGFCDLVLNLLDQQRRAAADARVLVRCPGSNDVFAVVERLNSKRSGVAMGFHSRLDESQFLRRKIPDWELISDSVGIVVHEKLLLEGFDDNRLSALAVLGPMRNARELIQQVGRVIRNRSHTPETAAVVARRNTAISRWWENYRAAEQNPDQWRYQNDEFRRSFDPTSVDFGEDLEIAFSARLFSSDDDVDAGALLEEVMEELAAHEIDVYSKFHDAGKNVAAAIYELNRQVPFIKDKIYSQASIGYILIHERDGVVFFRDSHGLSPAVLDHKFTRMQPRALQKLFGTSGSRITFVDLANCDVSQAAIRARSARAFSIDDAVNSLNDHSHYCRSARGYSTGNVDYGQRYLGFGRSRVSDASTGSVKDFLDWAEYIASAVKGQGKAAQLFNRFAAVAKPPKNPVATSILIDFDEIIENLEDQAGKQVKSVGDVCSEVDDSAFSIAINGNEIPVKLIYDEKKRRFKLESSMLHSGFRIRQELGSGERAVSLLSYLNREQPYRITLERRSIIYAGGSFFEPRWKLNGIAADEDIPMRSCFIPLDSLNAIQSEKGAASVQDHARWQTTSLFGLIDVATSTGDGFPLLSALVCDDQNNESADFIGYDEARKVLAFIHAKFETSQFSATSFHDICGQVKKNLDYAHRYSHRRPPNFSLWSGRWNPSNLAKAGKWVATGSTFQKNDYVDKRLRRPVNITNSDFWERASALISDPSSAIESWIVLGGGFSYGRYVQELRKATDQTPQVVQIAYLLQSTLDAVSQIGAKLRIFCKP